ncbi:hypothetical protein [Vreelandella titanicae]|uniref:hypothetical protein n=1 Tax=Vreelandella titanicae TaxID=664683 RepID=UPI0037FC568D
MSTQPWFITPEQQAQQQLASWRETTKVSRFQAKAALDAAGYLNQVEALMADPETPNQTKLAWAEAQEFRRASPTIAQMAGALGLSDEQLDDLFMHAITIEA